MIFFSVCKRLNFFCFLRQPGILHLPRLGLDFLYAAFVDTDPQIANIIGPTLHIDWVIGIWLRSHVHDWANVGVGLHSQTIFADVGPTLANYLLLQRVIRVIFFHRNKSGPIFVSHCNKRCTYTQQAHNVDAVCMLE